MKEKDPAFLMYSKDWIEGTAEYMPDEKGVYIDLLCHQHQKGSLPNDIKRLAKMVGLSIEDFEKIWEIISCNFIQMDNRLVNRKLNQVMNQRKEKSKVNTITGTFAGLLRLGNFSKKEYKYLKDSFKIDDFKIYKKEELTERLTEWIDVCLKSIEDAIEDENINNSNINNWRKDYNIYITELNEKFEELKKDVEWLKKMQKIYPGIDIIKSMEQSIIKYWGTETGWKKKASARTKSLDWKKTFANTIEFNKVEKSKQQTFEAL